MSAVHHCFMIIPGHGQIGLHATSIMFGISIVASQSGSRDRKAMYVTAKTSGSFTLDLVFLTYGSYEVFGDLIRDYGLGLSAGRLSTPCRVLIPSIIDSKTGRGVDRVGIPENPIPRGDDVSAVARRMSLRFLGTSDPYSPIGNTDTGLVSNVIQSEYDAVIARQPQAAYFYPVGTQLAGSDYGIDTLYDSVPDSAPVYPEPADPAPRRPGGPQEF